MQALQFAAGSGPGVAGGGLTNPDQQQRQPAQQHVDAEVVRESVVWGRPKICFRARQPHPTFSSCLKSKAMSLAERGCVGRCLPELEAL